MNTHPPAAAATMKNLMLHAPLMARIRVYRHEARIATEAEAIRHLIRVGLEAETAKPAEAEAA